MVQVKMKYSLAGYKAGEFAECLMHIREFDGSSSYLVPKMGRTPGTSGAAGLHRFPGCNILYQSPDYSKEKHDNKEYWWVSGRHMELIQPLPKTNRESVSFLEK